MESPHKFVKAIFIGIFVFIALVVIGIFAVIYLTVSTSCKISKARYNTDCVNAMISVLDSDKTSFNDKNNAIWVLGQLADERALPILKNLYTGVPEHREPLDTVVSQYELRKAIKWMEEGNYTSWMYKFVK